MSFCDPHAYYKSLDKTLDRAIERYLDERNGLPSKEEEKEEKEMISKPNHYLIGDTGLDLNDVLRHILSGIDDGFVGAQVYNIIKYSARAHNKNGLQDYKKAKECTSILIDYLEKKK